MHGYVCRQYTHPSLSVETWTLKFNSLNVSHNRRTAYALQAECTWRVVLHTSSLWYRFSFINFSSWCWCRVFCFFVFFFALCVASLFFKVLLACVCQRHPRDCRIAHGMKLFFPLCSLYRLCVTIFMNEFLRLVWTRTLIMEMHVSTYVDLKRTYMITSHAPLLW